MQPLSVKKRIVILAYDSAGWHGGPIVNLQRLLPILKAEGYTICILGLIIDSSPNLTRISKELGIRLKTMPWGAPVDTTQRMKWITKEARSFKANFIILDHILAGLYAIPSLRKHGIKTIGMFRSDEEVYWRLAEKFIYGPPEHRLDAVGVVSKKLLNQLKQKNIGDCLLQHIPSGVPLPSKTITHSDKQLSVCYIGRLVQEQKRILDVVESMIRIVKKEICTNAGIIGSGPEEKVVRQIIDTSGVAEKFTLHGLVNSTNLTETISQYDSIILLSDYEGTPGAIMDAMSHGLVPVCLQSEDGTSELVTHNETGLLCSNRDNSVDENFQRLKTSLALRKRIGEAARLRIENNYSTQQLKENWLEFLPQIAEKKLERFPYRRLKIQEPEAILAFMDYRTPPWTQRFKYNSRRLLKRVKRNCKKILLPSDSSLSK